MPVTKLYTLQLAKWRKVEKDTILILNVTAKSGLKGFAPSWDFLSKYKAGEIDDKEYTRLFNLRMAESKVVNPKLWASLLKHPNIAITCYCTAGKFCHRHLLVEHFSEYLKEHGHEVVLGGEIT